MQRNPRQLSYWVSQSLFLQKVSAYLYSGSKYPHHTEAQKLGPRATGVSVSLKTGSSPGPLLLHRIFPGSKPSHPEVNTRPAQQRSGVPANSVAREEAAGAPQLLSGLPPLLGSAINSLLVSSWESPSPATSKHRLLTLCCPQPRAEGGGSWQV